MICNAFSCKKSVQCNFKDITLTILLGTILGLGISWLLLRTLQLSQFELWWLFIFSGIYFFSVLFIAVTLAAIKKSDADTVFCCPTQQSICLAGSNQITSSTPCSITQKFPQQQNRDLAWLLQQCGISDITTVNTTNSCPALMQHTKSNTPQEISSFCPPTPQKKEPEIELVTNIVGPNSTPVVIPVPKEVQNPTLSTQPQTSGVNFGAFFR